MNKQNNYNEQKNKQMRPFALNVNPLIAWQWARWRPELPWQGASFPYIPFRLLCFAGRDFRNIKYGEDIRLFV